MTVWCASSRRTTSYQKLILAVTCLVLFATPLFATIDPGEIYWFGQGQGELVQRSIGDDGLYRSTALPGLWLDPVALVRGDRPRLRAVVDLGCATHEHAAFVVRLAQARDIPT